MSKTIKDTDTVYKKARIKASEFNDKLKSREGASELLDVSIGSLLNYETGVCKQIPADVVVKMSEIYNAPELMNYYCCNECPIGKHTTPHLEILNISELTIQIAVSLKNSESIANKLMEIVQDGIITENEKPEFENIVKRLSHVSEKAQELALWFEKNLK